MKNKTFLTILVLVGLMVLGSNSFGQSQKNAGSNSTAIGQTHLNVDSKVPIILANNSSKVFWTSPSQIPATVVATVINNGKLSLDVGTISLNPTTKKQEWDYAGRVMPGGDGLIVFGNYIGLMITCQNSTTKQYGSGTLEVVTSIPQ